MIGAIVVEIPIATVLLSRVLKYRVNRWANIIAGFITIAVVISALPGDLDDMFFSSIEVAALLSIVWYAWQWPDQEA